MAFRCYSTGRTHVHCCAMFKRQLQMIKEVKRKVKRDVAHVASDWIHQRRDGSSSWLYSDTFPFTKSAKVAGVNVWNPFPLFHLVCQNCKEICGIYKNKISFYQLHFIIVGHLGPDNATWPICFITCLLINTVFLTMKANSKHKVNILVDLLSQGHNVDDGIFYKHWP